MLRGTKLSEKFALDNLALSLVSGAITIFFSSFPYLLSRIENSSYFLLECSFHFFCVSTFFFLTSFNRKLFLTAVFVVFAIATINAFFYNRFGIIIDGSIISNASENFDEASSLLNIFSVIFYLIIFLFLPFFLVKKIPQKNNPQKKFIPFILVIFAIFGAILALLKHDDRKDIILHSYPPVSTIEALRNYFVEKNIAEESSKNLRKIENILPDLSFKEQGTPNLKIIFVLGESARQKNFSINGYKRKTTPLLEKEHNLLSFKNVKPCYVFTSQAVSCMLSFDKSRIKDGSKRFYMKVIDEESVIKAFEKIGFTTAWFSTQKAVGDNNALLVLASQSQTYYFSNRNLKPQDKYDEILLESLNEELEKNGNQFIILQGNGSHFLYDDRYPEAFKKFTPTCSNKDPKSCSRQELINSYDNSILYTDYVLSKIIDRLKSENAILFYVSDHGQFLGEENLFYHGPYHTNDKNEHRVPLFIWMSNSVLKNKFYAKNFATAAKKITAENSHANIFDSLLHCAGASSKAFDRNLSLCKK